MENFKKFIQEYAGAILGGTIAILILCTHLYKLIIAIILIGMGVVGGNYVQRNKEQVKEKLKNLVDKM